MTYEPRWIDLDGVVNMRDLGGLTTADGRVTRERTVLRSDNLAALAPESQNVLVEEYHLTDVIDLRTNRERRRFGLGPLDERGLVTTSRCSLYVEDDPDEADPPWRSGNAVPKEIDPVAHARYLGEHYHERLTTRPDSLVGALRVVAAADGAVVLNCAAGKDRTGVVVALLLAALGVDDETILADYAASNERVERIIARLGEEAAGGSNEHDLRPEAQSTPPETMQAFLRGVAEQYGGVTAWLRQAGWTDEDQRALEAKVLVEADER